MSTETQPLISTPTKCKLCNHIFPSDSLRDAVILGANPQAKLQQVAALTKPFTKHLEKHHPEHAAAAMIAGDTFAGYLKWLNFDIDAETRNRMQFDLTRWKIRQMMTRQETRVSDERLDERLTAILDLRWSDKHFLTTTNDVRKSLLHTDLMALLKQLRDVIEERGRYTETKPS